MPWQPFAQAAPPHRRNERWLCYAPSSPVSPTSAPGFCCWGTHVPRVPSAQPPCQRSSHRAPARPPSCHSMCCEVESRAVGTEKTHCCSSGYAEQQPARHGLEGRPLPRPVQLCPTLAVVPREISPSSRLCLCTYTTGVLYDWLKTFDGKFLDSLPINRWGSVPSPRIWAGTRTVEGTDVALC